MSPALAKPDVPSELEGHRLRNLAIVERLRGMGVALDVARDIDLHFFLPGQLEADTLVESLKQKGLENFEVGSPDDSGVVSVTAKVLLPVEAVVQGDFIESLVRAAWLVGGVHDGWGTSVA